MAVYITYFCATQGVCLTHSLPVTVFLSFERFFCACLGGVSGRRARSAQPDFAICFVISIVTTPDILKCRIRDDALRKLNLGLHLLISVSV